ncbi:MAG TPA: small multi-drug export protein [Candidatus Moranbacteria bacterium]|nr:small multi-drug export protein [Candidatus Moranbacteria bacterium]HRZ33360.1 small multi-drug export protein [Candidatus Moranbacteria bacterium]
MHDFIINFFSNFPKELATFIIALIPITELRASIPLAVKIYNLTPAAAWFYSVAGTYFAMVIIVLLLDPISKLLSRYISFFAKFFKWLFEHTRKRTGSKMEKYGEWAIFILAATPIPFLGGMTAALASFVFGIVLKKSLPLMLFGTMVSGIIVLGLTVYF